MRRTRLPLHVLPPLSVLLPAVVTALLVLLPAASAGAHAILQGGSVSDGEVLDIAPEELLLEFNEGISATRGGLRVYGPDARRVDVGGAFQSDDIGEAIRVQLEPDLAEGTYVVTYRVMSADGHPVNGAFLFSIGQESADGDALLTSVFAGGGDTPWAAGAAVARWAMYTGVLLAAGLALAARWLAPEIGPSERRWAGRVAGAAGIVLIGATLLGLLLQNVLVSGDGVASLVDLDGLAAVLGSFVGLSAMVRVAGGMAVALAARRGRVDGATAVAGAAVLLLSLLLEGHTLTTGPAGVVWPAAAVHVLTAATWLGGLALLVQVLQHRRRADDPVGAARAVARFSSLLTASVVALVIAGVALSWVEVRALRALTTTTYGWVLVAKLAAVAPLLLLGLYNNRRLVPAVTARRRRSRSRTTPAIAGGSDEVADRAATRDDAWRLLRRTVRIEIGIVVVVLALTGVLVSLQPAAEAAGITGAFSENVPFEGIGQMTFTVDPNRAGTNEIHFYLLSDTGRPAEGVADVGVLLEQTALDIGPIRRTPFFAGPGHWILSGPELSVSGEWSITVEATIGRFDLVSTSVDVTVNP